LLSLLLVSSSALGSRGQGSCGSDAISGGAAELTAAESGAVVSVLRRGRAQCTGIVVGPTWVLTDAHCLKLETGLEVELADEVHCRRVKRRVASSVKHSTLDAALLELATPIPSGVEPLRLAPRGLTPPEPGAPVRVAGRGQGLGSTALAVLAAVLRDNGTELEVGYPGKRGLCRGDSGGPLFTRLDDGQLRVWGILRGGALDCGGPDRFTPAARLVGWVESVQARRRQRRD